MSDFDTKMAPAPAWWTHSSDAGDAPSVAYPEHTEPPGQPPAGGGPAVTADGGAPSGLWDHYADTLPPMALGPYLGVDGGVPDGGTPDTGESDGGTLETVVHGSRPWTNERVNEAARDTIKEQAAKAIKHKGIPVAEDWVFQPSYAPSTRQGSSVDLVSKTQAERNAARPHDNSSLPAGVSPSADAAATAAAERAGQPDGGLRLIHPGGIPGISPREKKTPE